LEPAARQRRATLLLLAPYRISGVAAGAVLAADAARPIWRGASRAPKLLSGVTLRLTLQKDARARSGVAEQMSLFCHPERSEGSLSSHGMASKGIPRRYAPRDDKTSLGAPLAVPS